MEYNEKGAGNSFEKLLAEFVEKTGVKTRRRDPPRARPARGRCLKQMYTCLDSIDARGGIW